MKYWHYQQLQPPSRAVAVWLLSADVLSGKFKTRWKQTCLHYAPTWGYYWLALDVEGACLVQDFHLPLVYSRLSYTYRSRTLLLRTLSQQAWQANCLAYGAWLGPRACHCQEGQVASHVRSHLVAGHQSYWRQLYQEGIQVGSLPAWCLQGRYPRYDLKIIPPFQDVLLQQF